MSFDTATRNRLATFVGKCRALLCGDFKSPGGEMARQLAHYGIQDTGKSFEVDSLSHLDEPGRETARTLRSVLAHKQASAPAAKVWKKFDAAVYDLIQEQGFTVLNRLCALRMAEERKILQFPCISKGLQSDGFELYEYHSGKANAAITKEDRFQHFVFSLFDELSLDLGSLFDRFSPQGLLFPAPSALAALLDLINDPELAHLWAEDETIGWIYQYWNSKEERKAMRDASAAPRNSRELAVRNQFFTPRYVVQFLTDNTLGRIWYEMCQGRTGLVDQCQYLVRRPNEIFLAEGEAAPEVTSDQSSVISEETSETQHSTLNTQHSEEALTQEELLKQPVHIPHRAMKDPREIRLLDPACGSMHFGLYAFDLFEKIYSEFWDLTTSSSSSPSSSPTDHCSLITRHSSGSLHDLYASKESYMLEVPKMIIENNIHGIDIDPRAAQIAGLALWLRAQRSWQAAGLLATQRPKVERSNIVCAEPMPGDEKMLSDFLEDLDSPVLAELVRTVFQKMQLAGEAGSLLKIEEEITTAIDDAKDAWKRLGHQPGELFSTAELNDTLRPGSQQELTGIEKAVSTQNSTFKTQHSEFWETIEDRLLAALSHYAESAGEGSYKRKLFAQDAAQGFAFIDLCRKRYDAVVMNPPFGNPSDQAKSIAKKSYGSSSKEMYAAFVDRACDLLTTHGNVGTITSRSGLFIKTFHDWRTRALFENRRLKLILDLGSDVLDAAMVETACYVLDKKSSNADFVAIRRIDNNEKAEGLDEICQNIGQGSSVKDVYLSNLERLSILPGSPVAYWVSPRIFRLFEHNDNLSKAGTEFQCGMFTTEDERFIRLSWEVSSDSICFGSSWSRFAKGGENIPFYAPTETLVKAHGNFEENAELIVSKYEYLKGDANWILHRDNRYGEKALNYTLRTSSPLAVRVLPASSYFANKGPAVFSDRLWELLGLLNSKPAREMVGLFMGRAEGGARQYDISVLSNIPNPAGIQSSKIIATLAQSATKSAQTVWMSEEPSSCFVTPIRHLNEAGSINNFCNTRKNDFESNAEIIDEVMSELDREISKSYFDESKVEPLAPDDSSDQQVSFGRAVAFDPTKSRSVASLLSYSFGLPFGRWDIRYATGERQAPELPDPFDPLPVCPPGMLQNESGLPLSNAELAELNAEGNYPLRITIEGILVDDPDHVEDIARRVGESLKVIWGERADAIALEACDILGVKELRDYFAEKKSGGKFFKDHLKRYSKSRRQAPIYWPLSTESGTYTLWIYYHRLTADTLYTAVTQFIEPKQEEAAKTFAHLNAKTERSKAEDKELESAQLLVAELATFRDSLLEIAKFWKPNLNDGVQITAAPLWKHFRLPAWQKKLKATWTSLEKGEYDWAHLAHSIWPERVIPKCTTDRSLAIAHGHETALWEEVENAKGKLTWQPKKDAAEIAEELVKQHSK